MISKAIEIFFNYIFAPPSFSISDILSLISVLVAAGSIFLTYKTVQQNRINQVPILQPTIKDVENPHLLKLSIQNIGNGLAKKIKIKLLPINFEQTFGSDLLPRKFNEFLVLLLDLDLKFTNGNNPLFNNGKLILTYEDVWRNKYSMEVYFKADVEGQRRSLGHLDKNLSGFIYNLD